MRKLVPRLFYLFFVFVIFVELLIFCLFPKETDKSKNYDFVAKITITEGGKTYACCGFVSGRYLFTVAHVFSSVHTNIITYENTDKRSYSHITAGALVTLSDGSYLCHSALIDERSDVAVLPLPSTMESRIAVNPPAASCFLLFPNGERKEIKRAGDVLCDEKRFFSFAYSAQKGQSGAPVIDVSGYVNAIICSYDKTRDVTYAVPYFALLEAQEAAWKIFEKQ